MAARSQQTTHARAGREQSGIDTASGGERAVRPAQRMRRHLPDPRAVLVARRAAPV